MTLKTCLLVTDDPDDHQAFSEATSETADAIVLVILDSQKALELLKNKIHLPSYLFLDLSMHGIRINTFLNILKGDIDLQAIRAIIYGEAMTFEKIENKEGLTFFNKEYKYSELQKFLTTLLKPNSA
ncbi:MAG TPA: hypothetical protein VK666_06600 [Chryseolinea sp.]|nr:hypothetical protein [Chryseolinea sp.]